MSFDTVGPLLRLAEILGSLVDDEGGKAIQSVILGPPTTIPDRISAWVSLGDQDITGMTSKMLQRNASYYIGLVYRVDQDQQRTERGLTAIIDSFLTALYADRTLGGLANDVGIQNLPLTKEPRYVKVVAEVYRLYAIDVRVTQYQEYPARPYTP